MNEKFNKLTDAFYASPQISPDEVAEAKEDGFDLIINNRPDGEEPGQPPAADIRAAAEAAGIDYIDIPIGRDGISPAALDSFDEATNGKQKVLGFCRTGTRSTMVRSFALARQGKPIDQIMQEAANGGYDLSAQKEALKAAKQ